MMESTIELEPKLQKKTEFIVFSNSPIEDVNHAKSFWKSLTLQPPLESRLVSADIRQRLRVATPPEKSKHFKSETNYEETKTAVFLLNAHEQEQKEKKEKIRRIMIQRENALNLLHKQRLERLQKEMISLPFKQKPGTQNNKLEEDYIVDELE